MSIGNGVGVIAPAFVFTEATIAKKRNVNQQKLNKLVELIKI